MSSADSARAPAWRTARGPLTLDRPLIMGVLNVTPDSFWSGGRHAAVEAALAHAAQLIEEGADLLDVGGESTRPGAHAVAAAEERARVLPVVRAMTSHWPHVPLSVDTNKASVAAAALAEGAAIINDVSSLRLDAQLGAVAAAAGAGLVLMHARGGVADMASYELADYGEDPVGEITDELRAALARAAQAGVAFETVAVDPGLGFAKRTEHSLSILRQLPRLGALGRPVVVGPSRKRFVGEAAGGLPVEERLEGTLAACVAARLAGAHVFRVHDVRAARRALDVAEAIRTSP